MSLILDNTFMKMKIDELAKEIEELNEKNLKLGAGNKDIGS
mgnify:CR=1 FL=1